MKPLRVLVACEFTGRVREAFRARGHKAWSVDLLPAADGSRFHITGDARDYLSEGWDMLIAHPPCTRLCNSGVRWLHERNLWADLDEACGLFAAFWRAPVFSIAIENPVMHRHARERLPADLPRPQIVQPWWFGDRAFKATGLYLAGLPQLSATCRLSPPTSGTEEHRAWSFIHRAPAGADRWKIRSATFPGIAAAMADQWGRYASMSLPLGFAA